MSVAVAPNQPTTATTGPSITSGYLPNNQSVESLHSQTTTVPANKEKRRRDKKDRPCDACRRRKSKCVINEGQTVCAACSMHGQQCTYVEDPRPRKRRVDTEGQGDDSVKRRAPGQAQPQSKGNRDRTKIKREESEGSSHSSAASPGSWQYHGSHVGYTTELEPMLFDISRSAGSASWSANYQKSDDRNAFLTFGEEDQSSPQLSSSVQAVEKLVGTNGPLLLQHFHSAISRSFPIIEDSSLSPAQRKNLDSALLCAIYTVSASSPGFIGDKKRPLDVHQLEELALSLVADSLNKPTLSTMQAGLLLMQRSDIDSKTLNSQLVNATFELGLYLDCTSWAISDEEKGLRKRLAWALYMQDQWCSLVHGRPSLIPKAHWAVQDLTDHDFGLREGSSESSIDERERGQELFRQMVTLTEILSNILETFYTQTAMQEYDSAGESGPNLILARAKPVQIELKKWYTNLPKTLKLDNGKAPAIIGHLHLAYFATEITMHRYIIRSLAKTPSSNFEYLHLCHICREAAKSRLISAMDFINRLRSDHLTSFWYFPSKVNFALVATFGSLLLATAPGQEETDFYRARLREYRWTLSVSAKNAGFLNFAIESLESSTDLLKSLPLKPKIEHMPDMPKPDLPIPHLIPHSSTNSHRTSHHSIRDEGMDGEENEQSFLVDGDQDEDSYNDDDVMTDVPHLAISQPIHSSDFQSQNFAAGFSGWGGMTNMSPVTETSEAPFFFQTNTSNGMLGVNSGGGMAYGGAGGPAGYTGGSMSGPFAGTAFEGLGARNWFDNSHHGSPEAEGLGVLAEI